MTFKEILKKHNKKIQDINNLTGIALSTLQSYSNGSINLKNIPLNKATLIANALDISVDEFAKLVGVDAKSLLKEQIEILKEQLNKL